MKMYLALDGVKVDENLINDKHSIMEGAVKIYSKLECQGKTHRSVCDRNVKDVNEIANSIPLDVDNSSNHICTTHHNGNVHVKDELIGLLLDKMTIM